MNAKVQNGNVLNFAARLLASTVLSLNNSAHTAFESSHSSHTAHSGTAMWQAAAVYRAVGRPLPAGCTLQTSLAPGGRRQGSLMMALAAGCPLLHQKGALQLNSRPSGLGHSVRFRVQSSLFRTVESENVYRKGK